MRDIFFSPDIYSEGKMSVWPFAIVLVLCILIVVILPSCPRVGKNMEHFDTYYNHDIGAYDVYISDPKGSFTPHSLQDANSYANYTWEERDPAGMTVYDKYYERLTNEKNQGDYEYAYRDLNSTGEENVYDSKFSLNDDENRFYMCGLNCLLDMQDQSPATEYDYHSGETSVIVQKNY
jgi:hypothetical protein